MFSDVGDLPSGIEFHLSNRLGGEGSCADGLFAELETSGYISSVFGNCFDY